MPRELSPITINILQLLWTMPWATASDLYALLEPWVLLSPPAVSNALQRARDRGWLLCATLGRERDAVSRWIFSNDGIAWGEERGWQRDWWHSATGARALARRIQVVEVGYPVMTNLFRSNLVADAKVEVFTVYTDVVPRTGEPITRWELKPAFWGGADVEAFRWLEKGPFDAVVGYRAVGVGGGDGTVISGDLLKVPVRFFSRFHLQSDVARLRRQMSALLGERQERWSLQAEQSVYGDYFPGAVALCSDGAAAAMVNRHFMETPWRPEDRVALGITDVQGNVLTPMSRPTNWWDESVPAPRPKAVGNMARMVELLQRGPYAAVNGRRSWRVFRTVATRPGSTKEQIAKLNNLEVHEIGPLLKAMENEEVILLWRDGYYLNVGGRRLYADAERVTAARVLKQQGEYARPDGRYRRTQRRHNMGTTETALALHLQGFPVFSALGMNVDYYVHRRRFRVSPDTFVLLPPGILVAVEFERSAKKLKAIKKTVWLLRASQYRSSL